MREWMPISTSAKGRLVLVAVKEFGRRPFDDVTVGELAAAAQVTTGVLYHHFDSKLGLYAVVRRDVEQRLIDRIEGALAASGADRHSATTAAMLVGFDFAVGEGLLHLVGAPPAGSERDRLAEALATRGTSESPALARILAAAWRGALVAVSDGVDPVDVRTALASLNTRRAA